MKQSLAFSVLIHAALVAALLFIGSSVTSERAAFFVELKSISVSSAPKGEPNASPAKKPMAQPPQKIAKTEKKKPEEVNPPVVEQKPAVVPEVTGPKGSHVTDAAKDEPAVETVMVEEEYLPSGGNSGGEVPRGVSSGVEGAPLSAGPQVSQNALILQIRDSIQRELTYPSLARKRRIEGTVVAGFTIDRMGQPQGIEIVESSGYSILDKEVVKIIQRAAPFPHITERVEVPVSFRLVTER